MTNRELTVIRTKDSPAIRAAGLLAQARDAADAHIGQALTAMGELTRLADEIVNGGETYPVGVRAEMNRLANQLQMTGLSVAKIMERARG